MKVNILGVKVDSVSFQEALDRIESFLADGRQHLVTTPYAESIVAAQADTEFRTVINESDLAVPDGGGLLAAAEFLSYSLPANGIFKIPLALFYGLWVGIKLALGPKTFRIIKERVSGTDLLKVLCRLSQKNGYKVYFLGGLEKAAELAAEELRSEFPDLKLKFSPGPQNLDQASKEEIAAEIGKINQFQPDFLFVAFKPVVQEKWLVQHHGEIKAKVLMAVGGALAMIAGVTPRAPKLLRRLNLEWLWRLVLEPYRLKRICNAIIIFPWLVFVKKTS